MKIAYIATTVHISRKLKEAVGSTTHTFAVAKELAKLGHEVHIFSEKFDSDTDHEIIENLNIHRLKRGVVRSSQAIKKSKIRQVAKYFKCIPNHILARNISEIARERGCDVVLERAHSLGVGTTVSKMIDKPLVLEVIDHIYKKRSAESAKSIIAYTKIFFPNHLHNKIELVSAGYDPKFFYHKEVKPEHDICYVGSFKEWDGLEDLVEAVKFISEKNKNIKALIVGDGIRFEEIKKKVLKNNLEKNITFTGKVALDEISNYIAKSKICAAPYNVSKSEKGNFDKYGFYFSPLKIFEYLACGKPVLATNYEKIRDVLSEDSGELVEEGNVNDIAEKIINLLEKRDLNFISKNNLELAKKFTWENVVKKVNKILIN
jgi:glycosyltransferase involved in cell wall biosynthesis